MEIKLIKNLCQMTNEELFKNLIIFLKSNNYKVKYSKLYDYIIAEGEIPICLIAHIDTVFNHPPREFYYDNKKQILWSPYGSGFDDRIGIAMIIKIINDGFRPSIIFTTGEEIYGIGAKNLIKDYTKCPFSECKAIIELDREGEKDSVYYNCNNIEFEKYINKFGFETEKGTFTDISIIAPAWNIAAVNLSVGYIDEHTTSERLNLKQTRQTYKKIKNIIKASNTMKYYNYIPKMTPIIQDKNCIICNKNLTNLKKYCIYDDIKGNMFYTCEECYNTFYYI